MQSPLPGIRVKGGIKDELVSDGNKQAAAGDGPIVEPVKVFIEFLLPE